MTQAHRSHVYQRLVMMGVPHLGVALIVAGATAACSALGLVAIMATPAVDVGIVVGLAVIAAAYLSLPRLLRGRG